jgi:hypothetical protein
MNLPSLALGLRFVLSSGNILTRLIEFTKKGERSVIRFLWLKSVKISEIYRRKILQYGVNNVNRRKGYE